MYSIVKQNEKKNAKDQLYRAVPVEVYFILFLFVCN